MRRVKNKAHSKYDKKYRELKRKITSAQYMLEHAKRESWDPYSETDRDQFYKIKREDIKERKEELNRLHDECRTIKAAIYVANHKKFCE